MTKTDADCLRLLSDRSFGTKLLSTESESASMSGAGGIFHSSQKNADSGIPQRRNESICRTSHQASIPSSPGLLPLLRISLRGPKTAPVHTQAEELARLLAQIDEVNAKLMTWHKADE